MKNTKAVKNGKSVKSVKAVKAAVKKPAKKKAAKKSAAPKAKRSLFGFPISVVVHRLAELNWKPAAVIAAIHGMPGLKACSPAALRTALYNAKHNAKELRKAERIATLKPAQLAQLTRLAKAA